MCVLFNTQEAAQVLLPTLFLVATPCHSLFDPLYTHFPIFSRSFCPLRTPGLFRPRETMRLPAVLTLALLGRGVTAQTAQLPADLSDEAALREFRDQWFEIVKRVPREGLDPCPVSCTGEGTWNDTSVWDQYPDAASMATCDKPVLFTMMVDTDLPPAALRAW